MGGHSRLVGRSAPVCFGHITGDGEMFVRFKEHALDLILENKFVVTVPVFDNWGGFEYLGGFKACIRTEVILIDCWSCEVYL